MGQIDLNATTASGKERLNKRFELFVRSNKQHFGYYSADDYLGSAACARMKNLFMRGAEIQNAVNAETNREALAETDIVGTIARDAERRFRALGFEDNDPEQAASNVGLVTHEAVADFFAAHPSFGTQ